MTSYERRTIKLQGRTVNYRVVVSKAARQLRVRVGLSGVEVVQPFSRHAKDAADFLRANGNWISKQLDRIQPFHKIRKPTGGKRCEILFRGIPTVIHVNRVMSRPANRVIFEN